MSGRQINRADWTKERITAFKRYLGGDEKATFHGRKKNGEPYKKALSVAKLIEFYKPLQFSFRKGTVYVSGPQFGARQILTDDQVKQKAIALYKHKETGLGKAPSIYNYMKTKYVNVSYKKVEQAIQSLASYQKYEARQVQKPKARKVVVSGAPGETLDADLMTFPANYFLASRNEGFQGLAVVVDRFSGYIGIAPLRKMSKGKGADIVSELIADLITSPQFPSKRGGKIFHDGGGEFQGIFPEKMRQIGYTNVLISASAGAPSAHAERAVGIIRKLVNIKLTSGGQKPRKGKERWWPLVRTLVAGYNKTPLTDARAPYTPNQLKNFSGAKKAKIRALMNEQGFKRVKKQPSRTDSSGNRVTKTLKVLEVGNRVRYAIEHVRKTGANKRPYPKQRWSDNVHTVERIIKRKLGFASYVLSGLPSRRFEREDLQGPL